MRIVLIVGILVLVVGCSISPTLQDVDVQRCKVYGLKAYQESDVKKFKEIRISDCVDVTQKG